MSVSHIDKLGIAESRNALGQSGDSGKNNSAQGDGLPFEQVIEQEESLQSSQSTKQENTQSDVNQSEVSAQAGQDKIEETKSQSQNSEKDQDEDDSELTNEQILAQHAAIIERAQLLKTLDIDLISAHYEQKSSANEQFMPEKEIALGDLSQKTGEDIFAESEDTILSDLNPEQDGSDPTNEGKNKNIDAQLLNLNATSNSDILSDSNDLQVRNHEESDVQIDQLENLSLKNASNDNSSEAVPNENEENIKIVENVHVSKSSQADRNSETRHADTISKINERFRLASQENTEVSENEADLAAQINADLASAKITRDSENTRSHEVDLPIEEKNSISVQHTSKIDHVKEPALTRGPNRLEIKLVNMQAKEAINEGLKTQKNHIEIRLEPRELGRLNIKMDIHDSKVNIHFISDNLLTKEALDKDLMNLKGMLESSGLGLGNVEIGLGFGNQKDGAHQTRDNDSFGFNNPSKIKTESKASQIDLEEVKKNQRIAYRAKVLSERV